MQNIQKKKTTWHYSAVCRIWRWWWWAKSASKVAPLRPAKPIDENDREWVFAVLLLFSGSAPAPVAVADDDMALVLIVKDWPDTVPGLTAVLHWSISLFHSATVDERTPNDPLLVFVLFFIKFLYSLILTFLPSTTHVRFGLGLKPKKFVECFGWKFSSFFRKHALPGTFFLPNFGCNTKIWII